MYVDDPTNCHCKLDLYKQLQILIMNPGDSIVTAKHFVQVCIAILKLKWWHRWGQCKLKIPLTILNDYIEKNTNFVAGLSKSHFMQKVK